MSVSFQIAMESNYLTWVFIGGLAITFLGYSVMYLLYTGIPTWVLDTVVNSFHVYCYVMKVCRPIYNISWLLQLPPPSLLPNPLLPNPLFPRHRLPFIKYGIYWAYYRMFESPALNLAFLVLGVACLLPDMLYKVYTHTTDEELRRRAKDGDSVSMVGVVIEERPWKVYLPPPSPSPANPETIDIDNGSINESNNSCDIEVFAAGVLYE